MTKDDIPRTHCFSLGDFHDYESCVFRFFVNHHLQKKYELATGSPNQAIGSLLDLGIKKYHQTRAYGQSADYLPNLIKAAEVEMRQKAGKSSSPSFYSAQIPFLTADVIARASEIFQTFYLGVGGKFHQSLSTKTFWDYVIPAQPPLKLWGGPDSVEMGADGVPEVVDYKYFEDVEHSKDNLDMDLMPKIYTLLCAEDLQKSGFNKARFIARFWQEPGNGDYYEEFDLQVAQNWEDFFRDKIAKILRTQELTFCEKKYCRVCAHPEREKLIRQLHDRGWINK